MKTEESGKRIKVTGTINAGSSDAAVDWLAKRLAKRFGGCTIRPGATGFWIDGNGESQREVATIIEVSFVDDYEPFDPRFGLYVKHPGNHSPSVEKCRHLFATTQFSVGGEWTHIEVSEFEAAHTHHEHYACAKIA